VRASDIGTTWRSGTGRQWHGPLQGGKHAATTEDSLSEEMPPFGPRARLPLRRDYELYIFREHLPDQCVMRLGKTSSVEELQVVSRYESLRKMLLCEQFKEHIERPLAYWALPTDRRLPLAFLGRTLKDLLSTPFVELSATPGIGQKKIRSFVNLLARVANTNPADLPVDLAAVPIVLSPPNGNGGSNGNSFEPMAVSEVVWAQWRASVVRHALGDELLGRFAPSLRNMTRVIWNAPLGAYTQYTLSEIRAMKTHGDKRVRAILEVFHAVHCLVAHMGTQEHLVVRIRPRLISRIEDWIEHQLQTPGMPDEAEIRNQFLCPVLEQIRVDATQQIATLAENRLGVHAPIASVRQSARAMGLTRARVYQLLNEINDIMNVRWPNGRHQVYEFSEKLHAEAGRTETPPSLSQFDAAVELIFPGARRGAAGPLETIAQEFHAEADESESPELESADDRELVSEVQGA
jgi:hypothetical protein